MTTDRTEKRIPLHTPLKRIWRALSDSSEFGFWFGMKFDGPFLPAAKMRGVIVPTTVNAEVAKAQEPYEGMPFEITIVQMEPEHLFSFSLASQRRWKRRRLFSRADHADCLCLGAGGRWGDVDRN